MKRAIVTAFLLTASLVQAVEVGKVDSAKVRAANCMIAKQALTNRAASSAAATDPATLMKPAITEGVAATAPAKAAKKAPKPLSNKQLSARAIAAVKAKIGPSATAKGASVDVFTGPTDNSENASLHPFTRGGLVTVYAKQRIAKDASFMERLAAKFSRSNKTWQVQIDGSNTVSVVDEQRRAPQYKLLSFLKLRVPALQLYRDLSNNPTEFAQLKTNATMFGASASAGALHLNLFLVGGAMYAFGRSAYSAISKAVSEENAVRSAAFDLSYRDGKALAAKGQAVGLTDLKSLYDANLQGTGTAPVGLGSFYAQLRLRESSEAGQAAIAASKN
jgi:hypothetical protein